MGKETGYMPDLSGIDLDSFKSELKTGRLLPSRRPLLDGIDEKFARLEKAGFRDLATLKSAINKSSSQKKTAEITGLPVDYLKLLKREVGNVLPTPVKFADVPNIADEVVSKLSALNIADTEMLFPYIRDAARRTEFKTTSGLSEEMILWLARLVDVSRIKWVGPKLARLIVDTEYDTVDKLAAADPVAVLTALNAAKNNNKAYDGALGINDIDSWIRQVVIKTPLIIAYS